MFVQVVAPGTRQSPHTQWAVAGLQLAFGTVTQSVGHWPLVSVQYAPVAGLHSQHTGGATQSHFPEGSFVHCDPAGAVGGQGPLQPVGDAVSL